MNAIAEGSFVITNGSPDGPGNLASALNPNPHFGNFTESNLNDRVEFWLKKTKVTAQRPRRGTKDF